jgi:hypothetical protein
MRETLSTEAAVFDWLRLGCFTGSRVGEYAQSHAKLHHFARVPHNADAGKWAGTPIAFCQDDFTFYTKDMNSVQPHLLQHKESTIHFVHIRFRYDKSKNNFTIRKFQLSGHPILCPIKAALSIIYRASALGSTPAEPLAVRAYTEAKKPLIRYTYLRSQDIIKHLRTACKQCYSPGHFLHENSHLLVAHSTRVTAAVALYNSGMQIPAIAYRLRWSEASVSHYLREATTQIEALTNNAIAGATQI